jgi:putative colanic acid biosysnthesis UDP-glucose lipid carrier transferase
MELRYKYGFDFFRFIIDAGVLTICFFLSYFILHFIFHTNFVYSDIWMLPLLITGWYFSSRTTKSYNDFNDETIIASLTKTTNSIFIQFCLVILFFFSSNQTFYSKRFLLVYIALIGFFLPLETYLYKKVLLFLNKSGINKRKILIIGAGKIGMEFSKVIYRNEHLGYEIFGFLDDKEQPQLNDKYLGTISKLEEFIAENRTNFDEVVVALPNNANEKIKHIANIVGNHVIKLRIIPAYHEFIDSNFSVSIFNGFPMLSNRYVPLDNIQLRRLKRFFDIIFSFLILVFICSWLFPIVALAIKIDSHGPIFFIQERWGRKNRKIRCYKFRSMFVPSVIEKNESQYQQATKNDPRVTKVGAFLRKTSLDEFPQFWNVFIGDMSVVGPRPHPIPLNLNSKKIIENYLVRHIVKPGITGYAQVKGFRGETTDPTLMKARVSYDIWYIENWNLLLDIKIIFLTFWKVLVGDKNAY